MAALLGGLALVYVAVRLATIWRFPAYYDEAFYALGAWAAHADPALRFNALLDSKGPLLTWLALEPLDLDAGAPLVWLRMITALAGAISLVMAGLIAARLFDRTVAVTAVAVLLVMPFALVQGAMGIHEPLVTAAAMCALYLQVRLAEEPRLDRALLLGIALAAGLLTKDSGRFALFLLPLSLLLFDWSSDGRRLRLLRWAGHVVVALLIALIGYSLQKLSPNFYAGQLRREILNQYHTPAEALANAGTILQANWPSYRVMLVTYVTPPFALLAAGAFGWLAARRLRVAILLGGWIVLPIGVAVLIANKPLGRYFLPAMPVVAVLVALALVLGARHVLERLPARPWRRWALTGAMATLFLPAVIFDVRLLADPHRAPLAAFDDREIIAGIPSGNAWPAVARAIERAAPRGATIGLTETLADGLPLALGDPGQRTYRLVPVNDERAADATFVVENGSFIRTERCPPGQPSHLCSYVDPGRYRLVLTYERPRNGKTVRLFERVAGR